MSPRQRIIAIKLAEKINKNPKYAKRMGIEIRSKNIKEKGESTYEIIKQV